MYAGPRDIFFAVGDGFKRMALRIIPFVAEPRYRMDHCEERNLDFVELFSGRGQLTDELRNETLISGTFL